MCGHNNKGLVCLYKVLDYLHPADRNGLFKDDFAAFRRAQELTEGFYEDDNYVNLMHLAILNPVQHVQKILQRCVKQCSLTFISSSSCVTSLHILFLTFQ